MPSASSRNPASGDRRGSARIRAGRCAREGGSKPGLAWPQSPPPLRAELGSPPPGRLPRPAAADAADAAVTPARVPAPRRAAPRPLGRFHGPWCDGVAMVTGRRRGGGHLRRKYRQMQALGRAPRLHCWTRAPATSGLTRNRRAEKVSGAGSAPGFPVSSLSLCTPAAPELRRPLGVRPGLGPSSAPGSQVTSPSPRGRRWHFTLYWKAGNNLALPASAHSPHRPHRHCC